MNPAGMMAPDLRTVKVNGEAEIVPLLVKGGVLDIQG